MSLSTITINSIDYVAYASVAEADAYLAIDPLRSAAWAALSADEKGAALVAATRRLDLFRYTGTKTDSAQLNEWPRTGATRGDTAFTATDEVPQSIEDAASLLAGSIVLDATASEKGSGSNVKEVGAGSAKVAFFKPVKG